jgi:putative Mg2+ transporter-C (MgtC) family protein
MFDIPGIISWAQLGEYVLKILVAFLIALPIAWERESTTRRIGLRTFPMAAVASCGYVLVAIEVVGENADAQARIIQGLITGIGFIGGGAILREDGNVRGTSTAASIWTTGIIGAAIAYDNYAIAIVISIVNYLAFKLLTPLVHKIDAAERAAREKKQHIEDHHKHKRDNEEQ